MEGAMSTCTLRSIVTQLDRLGRVTRDGLARLRQRARDRLAELEEHLVRQELATRHDLGQLGSQIAALREELATFQRTNTTEHLRLGAAVLGLHDDNELMFDEETWDVPDPWQSN
jgi:hypothetical protein